MYGQVVDVYSHLGHHWHLLWNLDVGSKKAIVFDDGRKAEIGALFSFDEGGEEIAETVDVSDLPRKYLTALPVSALSEDRTQQAAI